VAHDFEAGTPQAKPVPDWVRRRSGADSAQEHSTLNEGRVTRSGTAGLPLASSSGERDARGPSQHTPGDSLPHSAFPDPRSAFEPKSVSRQELKRELDSLRRLIESRK
jgi:hypothetical protein